MPSPRRRSATTSGRQSYRLYRRRRSPVYRAGIQLTVVALLPLWPLVAYPLERSRWVRPRQRPFDPALEVRPGSSRSYFLHRVARHPLVIALGAPMRFLASRPRFFRRSGSGGEGPPEAGVREPRRPRNGPPQDAIALPEPRG